MKIDGKRVEHWMCNLCVVPCHKIIEHPGVGYIIPYGSKMTTREKSTCLIFPNRQAEFEEQK